MELSLLLRRSVFTDKSLRIILDSVKYCCRSERVHAHKFLTIGVRSSTIRLNRSPTQPARKPFQPGAGSNPRHLNDTMTLRPLLLVAAALLLAAALTPRNSFAQNADVIRGRVTGPDSAALEGVTVTVTSISGNVSRTARTNSDGRFTVTFPSGEGDYLVPFASLGFAAKRFEVKRSVDEDILVADTRLARVGTVLDPTVVTAQRDRVPRNSPTPEVSGTEQAVTNAAVPANLMGDLAAMAATLPGVQSVPEADGSPDGYSVLGLGADQNNTTLNGLQFGGSSLPRDAQVGSSLITSPYDVSRGGFSGAQFSLRTRSGSNFMTRGMS